MSPWLGPLVRPSASKDESGLHRKMHWAVRRTLPQRGAAPDASRPAASPTRPRLPLRGQRTRPGPANSLVRTDVQPACPVTNTGQAVPPRRWPRTAAFAERTEVTVVRRHSNSPFDPVANSPAAEPTTAHDSPFTGHQHHGPPGRTAPPVVRARDGPASPPPGRGATPLSSPTASPDSRPPICSFMLYLPGVAERCRSGRP